MRAAWSTCNRNNKRQKIQTYKHDRYPEGVPEELLPDPDEGKVIRFIVKYKPGRAQSVKRKIDGQLSESISIDAALTDIAKLPDKEHSFIAGDTLAEVEITPIETADLSNYEVLILDEPLWPSEFADTLDSLGAASGIEYIQPDFELSFASLSLEILEPEGTEIKQPITETEPVRVHTSWWKEDREKCRKREMLERC